MKVATIETNKGTIRIQLHDDKVPKTVENFEKLAGDGFCRRFAQSVSALPAVELSRFGSLDGVVGQVCVCCES